MARARLLDKCKIDNTIVALALPLFCGTFSIHFPKRVVAKKLLVVVVVVVVVV